MGQKWQKENREKANAVALAWKKRNPEKVKLCASIWRQNHPEYSKEYHKKHRSKSTYIKVVRKKHVYVNKKDSYLQKNYLITLDEYNLIFSKQEGRCVICGKHQSEIKKALSVDHCHKTGKVRGLLCGKCNMGLGSFEDDIENLKCAILYLNNNQQMTPKD
jgi:hypothetical protein